MHLVNSIRLVHNTLFLARFSTHLQILPLADKKQGKKALYTLHQNNVW